ASTRLAASAWCCRFAPSLPGRERGTPSAVGIDSVWMHQPASDGISSHRTMNGEPQKKREEQRKHVWNQDASGFSGQRAWVPSFLIKPARQEAQPIPLNCAPLPGDHPGNGGPTNPVEAVVNTRVIETVSGLHPRSRFYSHWLERHPGGKI